MPKVAGYRLVWLAERGVYELQESQGERLLTLVSEDSAWFAWLAAIPSFTFRGQHGQLTVRKESRQRGATYWYAYRRRGQKMATKYLGRTTDLTLARLEEVSLQLIVAAPPSAQDLPAQDPSQERRGRLRETAPKVQGPRAGADASTLPVGKVNGQRDLGSSPNSMLPACVATLLVALASPSDSNREVPPRSPSSVPRPGLAKPRCCANGWPRAGCLSLGSRWKRRTTTPCAFSPT